MNGREALVLPNTGYPLQMRGKQRITRWLARPRDRGSGRPIGQQSQDRKDECVASEGPS